MDPVESLILLPLKNEILYLSDMVESIPIKKRIEPDPDPTPKVNESSKTSRV